MNQAFKMQHFKGISTIFAFKKIQVNPEDGDLRNVGLGLILINIYLYLHVSICMYVF